jgi:hypothetical protein
VRAFSLVTDIEVVKLKLVCLYSRNVLINMLCHLESHGVLSVIVLMM